MADLFEVGVLFAALALVGAGASRLDKSVIPFYILVGMALSESVAGRLLDGAPPAVRDWGTAFVVEPTEFVDVGAELGIVFLLFFLGLEFNLDRLIQDRDRITRAGIVDLGLNFGVGLLLGWALFREPLAALLVAGIVYISSSAIITKSLIDLGWIANDEANPMLGTLVFEDLFIAVYLAVAVALLGGSGDVAGVVRPVAVAIGFIVVLLLAVHYGTAFFERALRTTTNEFLVLRAVGITVFVAGVALALGVSEAVAAFFVGMAFSATSKVHELENLLEPVRDLFAGVFFFWIGLETDPAMFGGVALFVLAAAVLTTPTKLVSGYLGGRTYGLSPRRSARVGLGMVTRGEFSLIIATVALSAQGGRLAAGVADDIYAFAVGYVLVMSIVGTLLMQYSAPFETFATNRFGVE